MITVKEMSVSNGGDSQSLPALITQAANRLASATSAAEVLDARDMASVAYDASKKAARMARAKGAHDELVAKAHRAQADALLIESMAKLRLADEYDAAQDRGEVAKSGQYNRNTGVPERNTSAGGDRSKVPEKNFAQATTEELGISRKDIHEARKIRDAEKASPGTIRKALEERLEAGEEPTKASLKKALGINEAKSDPEEKLYNGLSAADYIAELEENAKGDLAKIKKLEDELTLFKDMKMEFERGGFQLVIQRLEESNKSLSSRLATESQHKAANHRKAEYWKKEAIKLGYTRDLIIG